MSPPRDRAPGAADVAADHTRRPRVAAVVPAFDEAALVARTLRAVPARVDAVWVVDDGSRDDTAARAAAVPDPRVRVVRHPRNLGVGAAIATGYRHAFADGADVAVVMAGDGQMHPDDLPGLLAPVLRGEADYAKGDRLSWPGARGRMPWTRYVGNHALSRLTRWATGVPVRDSQCGYTALSRRGARRIDLDDLWPRYGYPNDLVARVAGAGLRLAEVPVRPVYGDERSGVRWFHAVFVVPWVLARAGLRRGARSHPSSAARPRAHGDEGPRDRARPRRRTARRYDTTRPPSGP